MTTMNEQAIETLNQEIEELKAVEVHVATNSGTFGATEACRKCGSGDPRIATRNVYETVGGTRRETGPDEDSAPGRMRKLNGEEMKGLRKRLAALRKQRSELYRAAK